MEEILSSFYWLLVDSLARREDFTEITGSSTFPLKFCRHRWLENVPVSVRAQEIWIHLTLYIQIMIPDKKYTMPTSKSFKILKEAVQDLVLPAKLAAFELIAKQPEPFLTLFQSESPLIPLW